MTLVEITEETTDYSRHAGHYVDWGAIAAGGLVAFATSSLFVAFGSAIGLTITSFQGAKSLSMIALIAAAVLWFLWIQISSFLAGGYVAGRMRRRIGDAKPHEVEIRDGTHGLVTWALAVTLAGLIAAVLALSGLSTVKPDTTGYYVDKMLRPVAPSTNTTVTDSSEMSRIFGKNMGHATMDESDKTYLLSEISARAGVPAAEAQIRLDQTFTTLKEQADTTRRFGILAAFLTAASLLLGAVAAWWAAITGGRHRDEAVDHSHLARWY